MFESIPDSIKHKAMHQKNACTPNSVTLPPVRVIS